MIEKLKNKALEMNLKKSIIRFLIVSVLYVVLSAIFLHIGFQDKFDFWDSFVEGHGRSHYYYDYDWDDRWDLPDADDGFSYLQHGIFSGSDWALLAVCGIIGFALGIWYWVLCIAWAYRKACRLGSNHVLWVLAAVFFRIHAVIVLYLYGVLWGTCSECGMLKKRGAKYCDRCGNQLRKECVHCGHLINMDAKYCSNCGRRQDEGEDENDDSLN